MRRYQPGYDRTRNVLSFFQLDEKVFLVLFLSVLAQKVIPRIFENASGKKTTIGHVSQLCASVPFPSLGFASAPKRELQHRRLAENIFS